MTRIRTDNVVGTLTDDPLTNVATSMNSAGLANLDVVASPDEAIIILDPNRVAGAPEIVVVTSHSSSATTATITRGQFGTAAREHLLLTEWVHGPVGGNATSLVTAANDQGDFPPMGEWESYTPSNSNITVGNGTQTASFMRIGRTVFWKYALNFGSTTAFTGTVHVGLPVTAKEDNPLMMIASGYAQDGSASAANTMVQARLLAGGTQVRPHVTGGTLINATAPFTWASSDNLFLHGTYEAAS